MKLDVAEMTKLGKENGARDMVLPSMILQHADVDLGRGGDHRKKNCERRRPSLMRRRP